MEEELKEILEGIKSRLNLNGKNRVFNEGKKLIGEYMLESAEPEAFTKEFLISKLFRKLELEILLEKEFKTTGSHRNADYRVKSEEGRIFLVEAKPLNGDLDSKKKDSGINQIIGLFRLVEVEKNYSFGVATDGLRWIFIDKIGNIVADLQLEEDFAKIQEFLVGGERVISSKTEEEISKKFYVWYNALLHGGRFKNHRNETDSISPQGCLVNNISGVRELDEREQIAQTVIDRLIFIKFLQSKGIIEKDILKNLSELSQEHLNAKLRLLFFGVFNTQKSKRLNVGKSFKDVPYLNGSLFVRTEIEQRYPDYSIKADILRKVVEFLDTFKFVHKENFEKSGSLNPEILGYLFEKAMTSSDRRGSGSYYTPKPITKYISENTIYPAIIDKVNEFLKKEKGYRDSELIKNIEKIFILHETTREDIWTKIIMKLRVLDNACGSGAFLLAAGNILFDLNKRMSDSLNRDNTDISLKKLVLNNNLYGVDINPNAIEIAKLRLWLWLVDSFDIEHIEPLPNIEYNIRVGNSLIGYVNLDRFKKAKLTLNDYSDDADVPSLYKLLNNRDNFIGEYRRSFGENAKDLKEKIDELDEKIKKLLDRTFYRDLTEKKIKISGEEFKKLDVFHWGFEFSSVIDEWGYDVVIGNPPYVSALEMEKVDPLARKLLPKIYSDKFELKSHWDLYVPFILQSDEVVKDGGYFSYILPNPICREKYAINIRRYILENSKIKRLLTAGERNIFVGVSRQSIVFVLNVSPSKDKKNKITVQFIDENDMISTINRTQQKIWFDCFQSQFRYETNSKKLEIINEINKNKVRVGNIYYVNYGAQISSNKKGEFGKKHLLSKKPKDNPKKFFEGKDLFRYGISYRDLELEYKPEIMYGPRVPELFESPKLIVRHISGANDSVISYIDYSKLYCDHGLILSTDYKNLKPEDRTKFKGYPVIENHSYSTEFILTILNSQLMSFFYRNVYATGSLQGSYSHVYPKHVRDFPLADVPENQAIFINLCNYMLSLNKTEELRKSENELIDFIDKQIIDSLVYELYFKEELKTGFLGLISPYIKESKGVEGIKKVINVIKKDEDIMKEIKKIKSHPWVRTIEGRD